MTTDTQVLDQVRDALGYLEKSELERNDYFKVLCGLKELGTDGEVLLANWLHTDIKDAQRELKGVKPREVRVGTLLWLAGQRGWPEYKAVQRRFTKTLDQFTSDVQYRARYLQPVELNKAKFIFVKSEKGTGKTTFVQSLLNDGTLAHEARILNIGHRRTLLAEAANKLGLEYYGDYAENPDELSRQRRLSITVDSLVKLNTTMIHEIDVLILDETVQVLRHLMGATVAEARQSIQSILSYLVRKAKRVICLDADLNDVAVDFLRAMAPSESALRVQNTYTEVNRPIWRYNSKGAILERAKEAVLSGESVYVACTTKKDAQGIYDMLSESGAKARLVTSDETAEADTQAFIRNINEEIKQYSLVVASPSLGTGIDITTPIDHVFLVGSEHLELSHTDLLQAMSRVRNPGETHAWVHSQTQALETNPDKLVQSQLSLGRFLLEIEEDTGERLVLRNDYEIAYMNLWSKLQALKNESLRNLYGAFWAHLERQEWDIQDGTSNKQKANEATATLKACIEVRKENSAKAILEAKDITAEEYSAMMARPNEQTPTDKDAIAKYVLGEIYCTDTVTEDIVFHYQSGYGAEQIYSLFDLRFAKADHLKHTDQLALGKTHITDNPARSYKAYIRNLILTAAFGTDDIDAIIHGEAETGFDTEASLKALLKSHGGAIRSVLGLTGKGQNLLSDTLKQLGLKLGKPKQKRHTESKKRVRVYRVDVMANPTAYEAATRRYQKATESDLADATAQF